MKPLRIVVLGMMGRCPYGGQTWLYLNWLRAIALQGHEVYYVEDDTVWPYDPVAQSVTDDCTYAVRHIAESMRRVGLEDRWAYRLADRPDACWGMTSGELNQLYRDCDALLNIVGATDLRDEQMDARLRVYVETDPVTAELRLANGDEHTRIAFDNHHRLFTYGENYGGDDCLVPTCGLRFNKTRQPIDLELWPEVYTPDAPYFTTIGNYRQQGSDVEYNGQTYHWSKHHEWRKFIDLPNRTPQEFELAMMFDDPADHDEVQRHGWHLVSPVQMSLDVFGAYRSYFHKSRAEFTVAKDQNVRMRSGWFSERDACYLASGKPIVVQDTGFSKILPVGEGLFAFSTMDDIVAAIDSINGDYRRHCTAARAIANDYFDARHIGASFLRDLGLQ